jgi:hypothetical protein
LFWRVPATSAGESVLSRRGSTITPSSGPAKVEVFARQTPAQVTGFTAAAKTFNRGQAAHMIQ